VRKTILSIACAIAYCLSTKRLGQMMLK